MKFFYKSYLKHNERNNKHVLDSCCHKLLILTIIGLLKGRYILNIFSKKKIIVPLLVVLTQLFFVSSPIASAVTPPDRGLGAADSYAVFGKAAVTNDGAPTHIWGNVGADTRSTITGLVDSQVGGTIIAPAANVQTDAGSTYDSLMSSLQGTPTGLDLAGTNTIGPGVYNIAGSTLNGALTLDGAGVYIFRSSSSNTTAHSGTMNLINGACASNVFWAISATMTIGTGAHVEGTIIAQTGSITFGTGATLVGRAISLTQQVTLLSNQITQPICAAVTPSENTFEEDNRCIATTPLTPQWASSYSATGGVNLLWSATGGDKVDIEITNSNGEYVYKYVQVENTGHMFLPNVSLSQTIRIRAFNECEYGEWLIASNSTSPGLPNTGFAPHVNNVTWYIPVGILVGISASFVLIRRRDIF